MVPCLVNLKYFQTATMGKAYYHWAAKHDSELVVPCNGGCTPKNINSNRPMESIVFGGHMIIGLPMVACLKYFRFTRQVPWQVLLRPNDAVFGAIGDNECFGMFC